MEIETFQTAPDVLKAKRSKPVPEDIPGLERSRVGGAKAAKHGEVSGGLGVPKEMVEMEGEDRVPADQDKVEVSAGRGEGIPGFVGEDSMSMSDAEFRKTEEENAKIQKFLAIYPEAKQFPRAKQLEAANKYEVMMRVRAGEQAKKEAAAVQADAERKVRIAQRKVEDEARVKQLLNELEDVA